jgi:phospholipid/cholesterol/gamma-HCH transport system permease protein
MSNQQPQQHRDADTVRTIALPANLTGEWVQGSELPSIKPRGTVALDFSKTKRIDSAGIAAVHVLRRTCESLGQRLVLRNVPRNILDSLSGWRGYSAPAQGKGPGEGLLARIGQQAVDFGGMLVQALSVLTEMLYWGSIGLLHKRDFRKGVLGEQMYQLGYKAIGIVAMLSFLIGIVLALQSAMFLRAYGAGIFLASMIGWSMLREFGPLLTAIILAGRTGSATTAEVATMKVGEELDALQTMGINPIQFSIVPKFWAITFTMPLLSVLSAAAGIVGAFVVSLLYLDLSANIFWVELVKYINPKDFLVGVSKSVVFSWLIIWIGSYYGLKVQGGAEAVGKETTASVVTCIFVIIIADAAFSFV